MNIARGLFRAWIVISAIWIGLTVYLSEPKTYTKFWRLVYEAQYKDGRIVEFDLTKSQAALAADVTAWMQAQRPDINILEVQKDSEQLLAYLKSERQLQMDKAKSAWLVTVVPPLALLIFGLCILWIAPGFRPTPRP